jgi:hypothetical protein
METNPTELRSGEIFADPVAWLARFGITAELVAQSESLAEAA